MVNKKLRTGFRVFCMAVTIAVECVSCATSGQAGSDQVKQFKSCTIKMPENWMYQRTPKMGYDDVIWLYKDKNDLPWIDICITHHKFYRDLGIIVPERGRALLQKMISADPTNDYTVDGTCKEDTLWNRKGYIARFTIKDNKKIEPDSVFYYFGSTDENTGETVFIGITAEPKDLPEIDGIVETLKIKNKK